MECSSLGTGWRWGFPGKDSLTLLVLLAALRQYHPSHFDLHAVTVDMGLAGWIFPR